jgi:hypothetical protein
MTVNSIQNTQLRIIVEILRYTFSVCVVGFSGFIIVYGILSNESGFHRTFPNAHPVLQFFVFLFLIAFFGLLEGGHVCVVDVSKHSNETFKDRYKFAVGTHKLFYGNRISNLSKYLMGRQVMVIFTQFFLGSLVSFPGMFNFPFTDTPFPLVFKLIMVDTGLLNVTFVTWIGSLVPQLIATRYPVQFMNIIPIRVIVIAGLVIEGSGVAHFSWVLHNIIAYVFKMDRSVTSRVMANGSLDESSEKSVKMKTQLSESFWDLGHISLKDSDEDWKTVQDIGRDWNAAGIKVPVCLTEGSQQQCIKSLYDLMQKDEVLAAKAREIIFSD